MKSRVELGAQYPWCFAACCPTSSDAYLCLWSHLHILHVQPIRIQFQLRLQINITEYTFVYVLRWMLTIKAKQDALRSVNSLGLYKYAHYCTWSHIIHTVHAAISIKIQGSPPAQGKSRKRARKAYSTVLKCGRPYPQSFFKTVGPYARIKLRFKTFNIKFFGLKILSKWREKWDESTGIRPKKRKPMIPKLSRIKHTAFFYN
jgi:hypothetical protein